MLELTVTSFEGPATSVYSLEPSPSNPGNYKLTCNDSCLALSFSLQLASSSTYWSTHSSLLQKLSELEVSLSYEKDFHAHTLASQHEKEQKIIKHYEILLEKLNSKIQTLKNINQGVLQEKKCVEELMAHERVYIKSLEEKLKEATAAYSESLIKAEERDSGFMNRLGEVMKENTELHRLNQQLKFEVKEKERVLIENQVEISMKGEGRDELVKVEGEIQNFYEEILNSQTGIEKMLEELSKTVSQPFEVVSASSMGQLQEEVTRLGEKTLGLQGQIKQLTFEKEKMIDEMRMKDSKLKDLERELTELTLHSSYEHDSMLMNESKAYSEMIEMNNSNDFSINQQKALQDTLKSQEALINELNTKLGELSEDNQKIQLELSQIKCKTIQQIKLERNKIDDVDIMLENFCNCLDIDNLFVKIVSGVYLYQSKQVNISISNNNLVCRYSGIAMTIEEFLSHDIKKLAVLTASNQKLRSDKPLCSPLTKPKHNEHENDPPEEKHQRFTYKDKVYSPVRKHHKRLH